MPDRLIVLDGPQAGDSFDLTGAPTLLGAAPDCGIRLPEAGWTDHHATLEKTSGGWRLAAADPANPLEAQGRLQSELRLDHGLVVRIGRVRLRFVSPRAPIDAPPLDGATFDNAERAVAELGRARERLLAEVGRVIVGQKDTLDQILTAMLARGHCLLVGAPGVAKTLMVRTLAAALDLDARRIQFTPDLMPADITGTDILEESERSGPRRFRFQQGPVFTNILLADEINRTPPKTQAALLEAMQERRVTASGVSYDLPSPFLVLATQNPIELEGTYPLPEAQLDRFMFSIHVDYPSEEEETEILLSTTRDVRWEVERVLDAERILRFQNLVRLAPTAQHVARYAAALARATRPSNPEAPDFIRRWVRWGAGPRAGQFLLLAAKAHVLLQGRFTVSADDVRAFALPVLRHRVFRNFAAAGEGIGADELIRRLLDHVKEPDYE